MASKQSFSTDGDSSEPTLLYRCVCGVEFLVAAETGGKCCQCDREIHPEAIQIAMAATISVTNIRAISALELVATEQQDDPLAGQTLGHFQLEHRLGVGGMGAVYRSLDTSLQRYVAVKVLRTGSAAAASPAPPHQITALLQEAVAQARLNHPHVVTIYYVGRHQNEPFLAMELVTGPTLAQRLKDRPLRYDEIVQTALHVADALRHAQQFGIVHGDIKPSNLLMTADGRVKLSDFGLSRFGTSATDPDKVSGTPAYLAPETLAGKPSSVQSDIYALGVTLYELTFERLPFGSDGRSLYPWSSPHQVKPLEFPQPWPRDIPTEWAELLERMLASEPSDRFADYPSLIAALRRVRPVSQTPAGAAPRAIAYVIDQALLILLLIPFALLLLAMNQSEVFKRYQIVSPIVAAVALVVPGLHLMFAGRGRTTVGRYLFQLRVVDEHGLPLNRRDRLTREFMRSMFAWVTPTAAFVGLYSPLVDQIIDWTLVLFLAIDIIFLILRSDGRALHDLLCRSRVVLDDKNRTDER